MTSLTIKLLVTAAVIAAIIAGSYAYRALVPPAVPSGASQASLYGDALAASALTDQLITSLQDWLRLHPDDEVRYATLGAAYLQKVRENGDPTYYGKADAVLQRAVSLKPADFDAITSQGVLALARHEFRAALGYGRHARLLNAYSARALGVIADAQIELGEYANAVQSVQSMVDLRPDMSSYARVSYVRELYGDREGALLAMRQAADAGSGVAENVAWTRTHVGLLLFNRGDLDGARQEYEAALRAMPGYVPADAGLARVFAAKGDLETAISHLEHDARVMPVPEYVIALGDAYALAGRDTDAQRQHALVAVIAQLQQSNGVVTDMEMALFQADHASAQKDLAQTVALARRALQERPTIYAEDTLAWALYQTGQYVEAQTHSQQALRLGTQDALLWYHAAMIDAKLGRPAEAARQLSRTLEYNPYFSLLWSAEARRVLAELQ